jgi:hypothetical protein
MRKLGAKPSPSNLNFLVRIASKLESRSLALQTFRYLRSMNINPLPATYNTLLEFCNGDINEGFFLYNDMKKNSSPNVTTMMLMFSMAEECHSKKSIKFLLDEFDSGGK